MLGALIKLAKASKQMKVPIEVQSVVSSDAQSLARVENTDKRRRGVAKVTWPLACAEGLLGSCAPRAAPGQELHVPEAAPPLSPRCPSPGRPSSGQREGLWTPVLDRHSRF